MLIIGKNKKDGKEFVSKDPMWKITNLLIQEK